MRPDTESRMTGLGSCAMAALASLPWLDAERSHPASAGVNTIAGPGRGFGLRRSVSRRIVILAATAIALAGAVTTDALALEAPPVSVASYRTPNDWGLTPAGQQIDTRRTPDGVAVSPDGKTVFAVANSQLDNALTTIDASTLIASPTETSATYFGAAADSRNVWASGGFSNKIYEYSYVSGAGASIPTRQVSPFP